MKTLYDVLTVLAFLGVAGAYFAWGRGNQRLLMHLMAPAVAFAIANQLGNRGYDLFAVILIVAGLGYALMLFRNHPPE